MNGSPSFSLHEEDVGVVLKLRDDENMSNSRRYIETGDFNYCLVGAGPSGAIQPSIDPSNINLWKSTPHQTVLWRRRLAKLKAHPVDFLCDSRFRAFRLLGKRLQLMKKRPVFSQRTQKG